MAVKGVTKDFLIRFKVYSTGRYFMPSPVILVYICVVREVIGLRVGCEFCEWLFCQTVI